MKITRTVRWTRNLLPIAAVLALAVLPAAAAVSTQDSAPAAASSSLVAGGTVTPAPAAAGAVSTADADAGAADAATAQASSTGLDDAAASTTSTSSQAAAAAAPSDESGSTEARKVQRSCGAGADSHYVPSSGRDSNQCYDNEGKFQSGRKYTATHYSNEVSCGSNNELPNPLSVTDVALYGTAGAGGGYASVCSDDLTPIHGRATVRADADGSAQVVVDGDNSNPEDTTKGWASATASGDGVAYRCGKSYADGGRGNSDAPTGQDNDGQCSP